MYALINTMSKIPGDSIGAIVSQHRTIDAAERAGTKLQHQVKAANGQNSYLPTVIVELTRKPQGRHIGNTEWRSL